MPNQGSRDHDIVLFGATGFTGGLTAAELGAPGAGRLPVGHRRP